MNGSPQCGHLRGLWRPVIKSHWIFKLNSHSQVTSYELGVTRLHRSHELTSILVTSCENERNITGTTVHS